MLAINSALASVVMQVVGLVGRPATTKKVSDLELARLHKRATPRDYYVRTEAGHIRHVHLHPTKGWKSHRVWR